MNAPPLIPELAKHLRAIEEDNRRDREWIADERFDEIVLLCDIVRSHSICAAEAAWRRDRALVSDHLNHAREAMKLVLKTFNALPVGAPNA
jgi:hypothetical protein